MAGPGDYLDPSLLPLFLQSGLTQAPPATPPMTRALPDYASRDPAELAALRLSETQRPTAGRAGEGPTVPQWLMAAVAPETIAAKAVQYAPRLAAAVLGLTALGTPTEAGEGSQFQWTDPNQQRVNRLNEINKRLDTLATTRTPSPPGTQAKLMDSLNAEKNQLLDAQNVERNDAFGQFQTDQQAARDAAAAKAKAEQSYFDMIPGSRSAISAAVPFLSYLGGKYLGRRLPVGGAMAAGGVGGALEGALSQYLPTEVDLGLPRTSPSRQAAAGDLLDPSYWARMAAVSGGNAALGAYGAFRGAMGRRLPLPPIGPAAESTGAVLPPPGLQAPIPGMPSPGTTALPAPTGSAASVFRDSKGMWRDRSTGRFASPPDPTRPPPLMGE